MWDFGDELARLDKEGLRRRSVPLDPVAGLTARIAGREVLVFCSNDYLGFARHPRILEAGREALTRYGAGSASSRQLAGDLPPHRELEDGLASFLGTEAALLFSSGYLANVGALPALAGDGDVLFSDERNHASLIDGCRLARAKLVVYHHAAPEDLERKLRSQSGRRRLVVTESLFSMDGDLAPLEEIAGLARRYDAALFVDEAHALGTIGETGRGGVEQAGLSPSVVGFRMGTLSKALGSLGAFVAGSRESIEILRNRARTYLFDTSLPPASAAAATAALNLLRENPSLPRLLRERSKSLREMLSGVFPEMALGYPSPILSLQVGEPSRAMELSGRLLEQGFYVQGIRPPTVPSGTSRLRVTVSLGHTEEDLRRLSEVILPLFRASPVP